MSRRPAFSPTSYAAPTQPNQRRQVSQKWLKLIALLRILRAVEFETFGIRALEDNKRTKLL